jgi:predicted signal transduction protein with EAL and GGDEF domain
VNDAFGHSGGDRVLHDVGQRIAACVGETDTVARLGGDEYVVACDDLEGMDELAAIAARIRRGLSLPFRADGEAVTINASIGVAISGNEAPAEVLLRNADMAMYAAKEAGGNRIEHFDDALYAQARRRHEVMSEIERGLALGQFHTFFQPEVDLTDDSLFGFEALVRWTHPVQGLVSPGDFIPLAEQSGAVVRVGQQVLRDSCLALQSWPTEARAPSSGRTRQLMTSVNLSPVQVADPGLTDMVQQVLEETGVEPGQLCLEVTESTLMDFDMAAKALGSLKDLGVSIAIDDFGTGYSSLSRLKLFPVDFLKIDRSFISGLGREAEDDAIVSAMISLSHSLGVDVIAEGIETADQLERLREFGCRYGQGYLWSRPVPPDGAARLARTAGPLPRSGEPRFGG